MFRRNLTRVLGNSLWVVIPLFALLLFLPHQAGMRQETAFLFLVGILVVNATTIMLPHGEGFFARYASLIIAVYLLSAAALLCGAISFSGGVRSPLFPLLLLFTAFACGLSTSSRMSATLAILAAVGHLFACSVRYQLVSGETQLLVSQLFFLFLLSFFFERLSVESREQARERTRAMEELHRLAEMNRAASGFVSAVSFEMRTPLTSILGFSELLASRELPAEMEREYLEIIRREADNLSRLVEDLLDISRLESGKVRLNREPARMEDLVRSSLPRLGQACDPAQAVLSAPERLPEVMLDVTRMKRALEGVFSFVSRRFGSGTETRISLKDEGRELVFTLNIRNREASVLRENGSRLSLAHWDQSEEDLDLAIANRVVAAHGGSFSAIRASGGWLTIVIRLPLMETGEMPADIPLSTAMHGVSP
ncbi:MAG: hypothetical protein H5T73_07095 [Actinobacteria bacterium]|nr:hypothetical protein [Actinomycetota bacterium]